MPSHSVVNNDMSYRTALSIPLVEPLHEKPVLEVPDQARHKADCTTTEDGYRLEILDLGRRGQGVYHLYHIAKTNALIICAVLRSLKKHMYPFRPHPWLSIKLFMYYLAVP